MTRATLLAALTRGAARRRGRSLAHRSPLAAAARRDRAMATTAGDTLEPRQLLSAVAGHSAASSWINPEIGGVQVNSDHDDDHHDHDHEDLFDEFGNEYHINPGYDARVHGPLSTNVITAGADPIEYPLEDTFALHSREEALHTIYLDFDGHDIQNTPWNGNGRGPFSMSSFSRDDDYDNFSDRELRMIQKVFQHVASDFSAWDVNVTTEEPPIADLANDGSPGDAYGIRLVIGDRPPEITRGGGVAYLNSFGWDADVPAFTFVDRVGGGNRNVGVDDSVARNIANTTSHEIGHTLGLSHDGNATQEYHPGNGLWAPIMGSYFNQNLQVVSWSRGQYAGANNLENDLRIIGTDNGFSVLDDDAGDTVSTAFDATAFGSQGSVFRHEGNITTTDDLDVYQIIVGDTNYTTLDWTVTPSRFETNLDLTVRLLDSSGAELQVWDPAHGEAATLGYALPNTGVYYLEVDGGGFGDPLTSGYSDYASLGFYEITGTLPNQGPPRATVTGFVGTELWDGNGPDPLVGETVFLDDNGNGVRDDGERFDVTDAAGIYRIDNVPENQTVTVLLENAPVGLVALTPTSYPLVTARYQTYDDRDFIFTRDTAVSGTVFVDTDADGVRDGFDPGRVGIRVYGDANGNDMYDVGEAFAFTRADDPATLADETGTYTILGLDDSLAADDPAAVAIRVDAPANAIFTLPESGELPGPNTGDGAKVSGRDFGYYLASTIEGVVFGDLDGDGFRDLAGSRDDTEFGLAGRTVYVDANGNGILDDGELTATTTYDNPNTAQVETGYYRIDGMTPGTTTVRVQVGSPFGIPEFETDPAIQTFDLAEDVFRATDIGLSTVLPPTSALTGSVFVDLNRDGSRSIVEPLSDTTTVYIDANDNGRLDVGEQWRKTDGTSNDNDGDGTEDVAGTGHFSFDVVEGSYMLRIVNEDGYSGFGPSRDGLRIDTSMLETTRGVLLGVATNSAAPVITGLNAVTAFNEGDSPQAIGPAAVIDDADSVDFAGGWLEVSLDNPLTGDRLVVDSGDGVTTFGAGSPVLVGGLVVGDVVSDGRTLRIELGDAATVSRVNQVLRRVSFANDNGDLAEGVRDFRLELEDGEGGIARAGGSVDVSIDYDASVIGGLDARLNYIENWNELLVAPGAVVSDGDSADYDGGRLIGQIIQNFDDKDRVALSAESAIVTVDGANVRVRGRVVGTMASGGGDDSVLDITFGPGTTLDEVTEVVRAVQYNSPADSMDVAEKVFELRLVDPTGVEGTGTVTLDLIAFNDAPRLIENGSVDANNPDGVPFGSSFEYVAGSTPFQFLKAARIIDPDLVDGGGTLTIAVPPAREVGGRRGYIKLADFRSDRLSRADDGRTILYDGVEIGTLVRDSFTFEMQFNENATGAIVTAVLRNVVYRNFKAQTAPRTHDITVTFTDNSSRPVFGEDAAEPKSVTANVTLTLQGVKPVVAGGGMDEGPIGSPLRPFGDSTVTDADSANFDGGLVRLTDLTGDLTLSTTTAGPATGDDVTVNGVAIGTVKYNRNSLVVFLNANATAGRITRLVQSLRVQLDDIDILGGDTGERDVKLLVDDGEGHTTSVTRSLQFVGGPSDGAALDAFMATGGVL